MTMVLMVMTMAITMVVGRDHGRDSGFDHGHGHEHGHVQPEPLTKERPWNRFEFRGFAGDSLGIPAGFGVLSRDSHAFGPTNDGGFAGTTGPFYNIKKEQGDAFGGGGDRSLVAETLSRILRTSFVLTHSEFLFLSGPAIQTLNTFLPLSDSVGGEWCLTFGWRAHGHDHGHGHGHDHGHGSMVMTMIMYTVRSGI